MTPDISADEYVVAYGYNQTFRLTAAEAEALMQARENELQFVRFQDRALSTAFSWIVPAWEVDADRLNEDELVVAEQVGTWLARPAHDLEWTAEQAMRYAKRLVKRVGSGQAMRLFRAQNGAYPSAKRFLMQAKALEDRDRPLSLPSITESADGDG